MITSSHLAVVTLKLLAMESTARIMRHLFNITESTDMGVSTTYYGKGIDCIDICVRPAALNVHPIPDHSHSWSISLKPRSYQDQGVVGWVGVNNDLLQAEREIMALIPQEEEHEKSV